MRIFWDIKRAFFGLPFVLPLTKGIVVVPAAFLGGLWTLQYVLPSNVYYDEYDGEARQKTKPTLA